MSRESNRLSLRFGGILGISVIALCIWGYLSLARNLRNYGDLQHSKDQLHQVLALLTEQRASLKRPNTVAEPGSTRLYGKNIVLSLVASGRIDPADPEQLGLLFRRRVVPDGINASSYDGVTVEALSTRRFPHLTDILGHAKAATRLPNTADPSETDTPVIALVLEWGCLLVGYSSGHARCLDADDLEREGGVESDSRVRIPAWLSDE